MGMNPSFFSKFFALFTCRHRDPMFDRVGDVAVWRCRHCLLVLERGPAQREA
jgi:hypothetical protein